MKNPDELLVRKSNDLIQNFKFSLSQAEIRVVNYIIANIDSPMYDEEFNIMKFEISEFYKAMGVENPDGKTYRYMKNLLYGLRNKTSEYSTEEYDTIVSWIEKPKIYKKSGTVELKLDDDLKPYLLKMNGFIRAQMNYYFQMTSKYSMRLYELLKSWEGYKEKEFEIDELKYSIDAIKKSYANFAIFKGKVLDVAVDEINAITDIKVTYEPKKRGKKITHIAFKITSKTKKKRKTVIDAESVDVTSKKSRKKKINTAEVEEPLEGQIEFSNQANDDFEAERSAYNLCKELLERYNFTGSQVQTIYEAAKDVVPKEWISDGSPAYLYIKEVIEEKIEAYEEYALTHPIQNVARTFYTCVARDWHPNQPIEKPLPDDFLLQGINQVPIFKKE